MNRESTNKKRKRHSIVRNAAETTPNEGKSSERGVGVGSSVYTSGGGSGSGMQEKNMLKYNTNQIIQEIRRMTVTPIQRKIMEQKIATLKSERVTRLRGIGSSGGRMVGGMSELAKKREEGHNMEITPLGEKGAAKGFLETAKAIDMRRFLTGSPGACEYIGTPVISAVDVESGRLTSSTGKKNKHKHKGGDIKLDKKSIENYSVHLTQNSGEKPVPTTPGISKRVIVNNSKKNALVEQLLRIAENRKENRSNRWAIEYARLGYLVGKGAEERRRYAEILVDNGEYMLAEDIIFGNQEEEEEQLSIPMLKLGVVVLHRMGDIERMGMLKERIQRIEKKRNKHEIKNKGYLFTPTQSDRHMDSTKGAYEHINGSDTNISNTGIDDTCDKNDRWDICGETEKRAGEGFDWYIAGESIRVSNSIEGWEGLIGPQKKKVTSQDIRTIVKMCWETAIKCDARTLEAWIGLRKHKMVDIQEEKRLVVEVADWSGSCGGDSMTARFFKNYVLATSERDNSGSDELLLEKARKELVGEHMGIVNDSRFAILEAQRCFEAEKYVESLKWAYLSSTLVSGGTVRGNRHSRGQSLPQRVENESEWVVVASLAAQNDLERLFAEATMLADYFGVSKLSREQITTGESGRDSVYLRYEKEMRGLAEILDETGRTRERVLTMFQRKYNNMADARSFGGRKLGRQHVGSGGYGANVRRRFGEYVGYVCSLGVEPRSQVMGKELKLPVCWYAIGSYYLGLAIKQMRSYGAGNNGGDQNDKRYSTRLDEGGNVEISIKKARKYLTEAVMESNSNVKSGNISGMETAVIAKETVLLYPGLALAYSYYLVGDYQTTAKILKTMVLGGNNGGRNGFVYYAERQVYLNLCRTYVKLKDIMNAQRVLEYAYSVPDVDMAHLSGNSLNTRNIMTVHEDVNWLNEAGMLKLHSKDYMGAISLFERAISIEPSPTLYLNLSNSFRFIEKYQESSKYAKMVLHQPQSNSNAVIIQAYLTLSLNSMFSGCDNDEDDGNGNGKGDDRAAQYLHYILSMDPTNVLALKMLNLIFLYPSI